MELLQLLEKPEELELLIRVLHRMMMLGPTTCMEVAWKLLRMKRVGV